MFALFDLVFFSYSIKWLTFGIDFKISSPKSEYRLNFSNISIALLTSFINDFLIAAIPASSLSSSSSGLSSTG